MRTTIRLHIAEWQQDGEILRNHGRNNNSPPTGRLVKQLAIIVIYLGFTEWRSSWQDPYRPCGPLTSLPDGRQSFSRKRIDDRPSEDPQEVRMLTKIGAGTYRS